MIERGGNEPDGVAVDADAEFAAFDKLPRALRDALNKANYKWGAVDLYSCWMEGNGATYLVAALERADKYPPQGAA